MLLSWTPSLPASDLLLTPSLAGRYGIVLDAGSSGTRLHVYRWEDVAAVRASLSSSASSDLGNPGNPGNPDLDHLPRLTLEKTAKTRPGVSTFGQHPVDVGPDHLRELIDAALAVVPAEQVPDTPVFLMATAGMRLLPVDQQRAVLAEACSYLKTHTAFRLGDCASHVRTISGETEGVYGWIAANYLLGGFDHPDAHVHGNGHHTIGFLDMGGASAQIAFAPNATETERHADDLQLVRLRKMNGDDLEHRVFVATWLGFGANRARERYVDSLVAQASPDPADSDPDSDHPGIVIQDPCMPKGLRTDVGGYVLSDDDDGDDDEDADAAAARYPPGGGTSVSLMGSGDFEQCLRRTYPLLGKDAPCEDEPCLLDGKHVPAIDFDVNHFIGVSEFWHTTHGVFGGNGSNGGKDGKHGKHGKNSKAYDLDTYRHNVAQFCGREWDDIHADLLGRNKDTAQRTKNAQAACFKAAWIISVLYDGIGIPRLGVDDDDPAVGFNLSRPGLEKTKDGKDGHLLEPFMPVSKIDGVDLSWTLGKMVLYASGEIPPSGAALPVGHGRNDAAVLDFEEPGSTWKLPIPTDEYGTARSRLPILSVLTVLLLLVLAVMCLGRRDSRLRVRTVIGGIMRQRRRPGVPRKPARGLALVSKLRGILHGGGGAPGYERVLTAGDNAEDDLELGRHAEPMEGDDGGRGHGCLKRPLERRASGGGSGSGSGGGGGGITTSTTVAAAASSNAATAAAVAAAMSSLSALDRNGLVVRTESRERLSPGVQMLNAGRRSGAGSPARLKSPQPARMDEMG